jgi:hypothetical protein
MTGKKTGLVGGIRQKENGQTKSLILHGTSLHHPSRVALWVSVEV